MGNAASKGATRKLPQTLAKPAETISKTAAAPGRAEPLASGSRTPHVNNDSKDPQFMANLSRLGIVDVDHNMTSYNVSRKIQARHDARLQAEEQAGPGMSTRNKIVAASLVDLLEQRKLIKSREDLARLAERYGIDVDQIDRLARYVTAPTAQPLANVDPAIEEAPTSNAIWTKPAFSSEIKS